VLARDAKAIGQPSEDFSFQIWRRSKHFTGNLIWLVRRESGHRAASSCRSVSTIELISQVMKVDKSSRWPHHSAEHASAHCRHRVT
jgi:hypothetical protein